MQQDTLLTAGQQLTANASPDAETVIIDTGCANLSSVRFAFERLGVKVLVTDDKAKIKAAKRVSEIVVLLGGAVANAVNALYQSVLDGAAITVELIEKVIEEAKKDVSHPQLRPVVIRIRDKVGEMIVV